MTPLTESAQEVVIKGRAPEMEAPPMPPQGKPFLLVIFGASGDLTARNLLPALFRLYINDILPESFAILGCSRTKWDDEGFREKMQEACREANCPNFQEKWPEFAAHLYYRPIAYDSKPDFEAVAEQLRVLDRKHEAGWNRIFYLAMPPRLLPRISGLIGEVGLAQEEGEGGWSRIVVEKPFGRDLESALELNSILHQSFAEHQIFRIDHYLAKETVQNILMLRFANTIFEPLWNRGYIDYVGILTAEKVGVEHRAGYYEQSGVLRDMFQNHMLQLLALTAMEPPSQFEAKTVQDEKIKVFGALKSREKQENLILGQYVSGRIDGRKVPAYRDEPEVDDASPIPTFAALRVFIDNWRWRDVPFYLVSGKRLTRKESRIVIQFKNVPHSLFENIVGRRITANRLILGIYPEEAIKLTFQTKIPGPRVNLRSVTMDFKYYPGEGPSLEAYEKVLLDVIHGDRMLFLRQDGVELCWSFLTPILEVCCEERAIPLHFYEAGSWGPEPAQKWMEMIIAD
jgi:glucose-6-phosphate 1-dehydrogenase